MHREARRDEDQRVDAARRTPGRWNPSGGQCAVDAVVDDTVEEIDREERAEEHDLRRDEQEHAEHRRGDPRAVVDRRRPVVLVRPCVVPRSCGQPTLMTAREIDVLDGQAGVLAQALDRSRRSQPLRSPGNVETMISSTRSSFTACIAAVYGSGCTTWPCASMPSPRSSVSARRRRRSASVVLLAVALRRDDQEARRALRGARADPLEQLVGDDGLVRDHEHVRLAARVALDDDVLDRDAAGDPLDVPDHVPPHPAGALPRRGSRRRSRRPSARAARARPSPPAPARSRRRSPARRDPPRAAPSASSRAAGRPRRGACPRRRRSPGSAR